MGALLALTPLVQLPVGRLQRSSVRNVVVINRPDTGSIIAEIPVTGVLP